MTFARNTGEAFSLCILKRKIKIQPTVKPALKCSSLRHLLSAGSPLTIEIISISEFSLQRNSYVISVRSVSLNRRGQKEEETSDAGRAELIAPSLLSNSAIQIRHTHARRTCMAAPPCPPIPRLPKPRSQHCAFSKLRFAPGVRPAGEKPATGLRAGPAGSCRAASCRR